MAKGTLEKAAERSRALCEQLCAEIGLLTCRFADLEHRRAEHATAHKIMLASDL